MKSHSMCSGSIGATGRQGVKGYTGPVGSTGATGATGLKVRVINRRAVRPYGFGACPGKPQNTHSNWSITCTYTQVRMVVWQCNG